MHLCYLSFLSEQMLAQMKQSVELGLTLLFSELSFEQLWLSAAAAKLAALVELAE